MSYILYSSIARAGGIDLLLSTESFARDHRQDHRARRRAASPARPSRVARLRRGTGRALVAVGGRLTALGRQWAAPAIERAGEPALQSVR